jgi:hypothetical protein
MRIVTTGWVRDGAAVGVLKAAVGGVWRPIRLCRLIVTAPPRRGSTAETCRTRLR